VFDARAAARATTYSQGICCVCILSLDSKLIVIIELIYYNRRSCLQTLCRETSTMQDLGDTIKGVNIRPNCSYEQFTLIDSLYCGVKSANNLAQINSISKQSHPGLKVKRIQLRKDAGMDRSGHERDRDLVPEQ
jgi:hypothetical protein